MMRLALATAVALAGGFVVGLLFAEYGGAELRAGESAAGVVHAMEQPDRWAAMSPADVRSLKDELTAAIVAVRDAPASSETDRPTTLVPDTAESVAADQRLRETADIAIAAGRWTRADADEVRELMHVASPAVTHETLSAIAMAVNERRLELDQDTRLY